jgi:succinoglycan biosynthesis protein ExoA
MKRPRSSVLIPVRNEEKYIGPCLDSIFHQEGLMDNFEVIVSDGMSTDGTREIIHNYQASYPNLSLISNPKKIASVGLNLALKRASGEIILRVDGHTTIASDYISQCVEALGRTRADNVGGKMNAIGSNTFGKATALATSTPFGVGGARFHYSDREEWVDTVYLGAWPRRVFDEIGLFDEELVRDQDDEFNSRLREAGGRVLLSPRIKSEYRVRSSPQALWRQYFQYGFWKVRVLQKHPRQMRPRQFLPPLFVALLLCAMFFPVLPIHLYSLSFIPLGSILACYLLANLTASFILALKKDLRSLPLLPIAFAILHFSYGLGFLIGLVRFIHRWGDKRGKTPAFFREHARTP